MQHLSNKHILIIQHVPYEGLGNILTWLNIRGHSHTLVRFFENDSFSLQEVPPFDAMIILGGPMGVHDTKAYPWLKKEFQQIDLFLKEKKPILGFCLGAQILAHLLGGQVELNPMKEIGWYPIHLKNDTLKIGSPDFFQNWPKNPIVFHWHQDKFMAPKNSQLFASSLACEQQGFIYDDYILGLQFHLEINLSIAQRLVKLNRHELLSQSPFVSSSEDIINGFHTHTQIPELLFTLLDRWIEMNPSST